MSKSTRATLALNKAGVNFTLHRYDYDPDAERIGLQAAAAIGVKPRRVLKTLMAEVARPGGSAVRATGQTVLVVQEGSGKVVLFSRRPTLKGLLVSASATRRSISCCDNTMPT